MKRVVLLSLFSVLLAYNSQAQNFEYEGGEIGVDLDFSASTFGGNFGIGAKYGFTFGEYLVLGPSVRYSRLWFKNLTPGQEGGHNVWGGGAFVHARFFNALFVGAEFEMLKTPYAKPPCVFWPNYCPNNGSPLLHWPFLPYILLSRSKPSYGRYATLFRALARH